MCQLIEEIRVHGFVPSQGPASLAWVSVPASAAAVGPLVLAPEQKPGTSGSRSCARSLLLRRIWDAGNIEIFQMKTLDYNTPKFLGFRCMWLQS